MENIILQPKVSWSLLQHSSGNVVKYIYNIYLLYIYIYILYILLFVYIIIT